MEWEEKMLIPGFNVLLPLVERFRGKYKGDRGIEGGLLWFHMEKRCKGEYEGIE